MSQALHPAQLRVLNSQQSLPTAAQVFIHLAVVVTKWDVKRRTRRELRKADEHILYDVGLTREEAVEESSKPFWKD